MEVKNLVFFMKLILLFFWVFRGYPRILVAGLKLRLMSSVNGYLLTNFSSTTVDSIAPSVLSISANLTGPTFLASQIA